MEWFFNGQPREFKQEPFNLEQLGVAFLLLLGGFAVALAVMVSEWMYVNWIRAKYCFLRAHQALLALTTEALDFARRGVISMLTKLEEYFHRIRLQTIHLMQTVKRKITDIRNRNK